MDIDIKSCIELKVSNLKNKKNTIFKLSLLCFFLSLMGCAVSFEATNKLKRSNHNFVSRNERQIFFSKDMTFNANYLGKYDGEYIYQIIDDNGQNVYFYLPVIKESKAIITMKSPGHAKENDKIAVFVFYINDKQSFFKFTDNYNVDIASATNSDITSDYPKNVYVKISIRHFIQDGVGGNATDYEKIDYTSKEGRFSNSINLNTGLSVFDSVVLGGRNVGYAITVPADVFNSILFSPVSLVLGPCGGSVWGCP